MEEEVDHQAGVSGHADANGPVGAHTLVIVLHGGPGAAGEAAGLAKGLADSFHVLEPWQRGSGDEPLTVATHVEDLHRLIASEVEGALTPPGSAKKAESSRFKPRPALVGESWGAMLALAYAAAHPDSAGPIVLVGCGTFDKASRARLEATLEERTDEETRRGIECLAERYPDPGERFVKMHELTEPLYAFAADASLQRAAGSADNAAQPPFFDFRAYEQTWSDMLQLQDEGVYPAAFSAITSPVLMLHGTYDPHPGRMIRDSLLPYLPQLQYREFERCGHQPWMEKAVREEFFAALKDWLARPPTSSRR
jgi:pimeloyl-ACP methyl ester carboxylesterase